MTDTVEELRAENARLREALRIIAGGFTDKDAPSIHLPPHEFRSEMWTWSQKKAKAALAPPEKANE